MKYYFSFLLFLIGCSKNSPKDNSQFNLKVTNDTVTLSTIDSITYNLKKITDKPLSPGETFTTNLKRIDSAVMVVFISGGTSPGYHPEEGYSYIDVIENGKILYSNDFNPPGTNEIFRPTNGDILAKIYIKHP